MAKLNFNADNAEDIISATAPLFPKNGVDFANVRVVCRLTNKMPRNVRYDKIGLFAQFPGSGSDTANLIFSNGKKFNEFVDHFRQVASLNGYKDIFGLDFPELALPRQDSAKSAVARAVEMVAKLETDNKPKKGQ